MNNRERVLATLAHRQPDRTPFNIGFTQNAYEKMVEYYSDPRFLSSLEIENCLTQLSCEPDIAWQEIRPDIWQDQFGVQWNRSIDRDIGNVCNRLVTPATLESYRFPDPHDPTRYASYAAAVQAKDSHFLVVNLGFSLFERAWTLAGLDELLMAMAAEKTFVHALLDRILEFNLQVIEHACSFDIDAMLFGDDWGMQTGVMMGARLWREFIKPRVQQMYRLVKSRGKFVFIHSCGKVDQLFPELIECGLDMFNPFQPEVMDVYQVKRQYGSSLSFYGGISTQRSLPYATPQQVKDEVYRLIETIGRGGGYIAAPAHDIPGDAKPENIAAMLEALIHQV